MSLHEFYFLNDIVIIKNFIQLWIFYNLIDGNVGNLCCRMEMEPGKLFISGISWYTIEDRLRNYFQSFEDKVEAVIMRDRTTRRARGFEFIIFACTDVKFLRCDWDRLQLKQHFFE